MSDILLSLEVSVLLFTQFILFFILSVALFHTVIILSKFKIGATTLQQYAVEKRAYLVIVIISVVLVVKISLLPFFTYTLNELSNIIPGAMCGAGVISANEYGVTALLLKILVIMLGLLWIVLNHEDQRALNYPYFRKKLWFFIIIYIFFILELFFELNFFTKLSTDNPVLCCSAIYNDKTNINNLPLNLSIFQLVGVFYFLYFVVILSAYFQKKVLLFFSTNIFIYISYYAIVYFFATYIYELPTHRCPFCLLQHEYNYIGYIVFGSLFIASFYALSFVIFKFINSYLRVIFWQTFFVLVTSIPFIFYIIKNNAFL